MICPLNTGDWALIVAVLTLFMAIFIAYRQRIEFSNYQQWHTRVERIKSEIEYLKESGSKMFLTFDENNQPHRDLRITITDTLHLK